MSSQTVSRKLLSSRNLLIGAPCLIGVTAIAALLTSMTMGRKLTPQRISQSPRPSDTGVENAVQPLPPPVISAQPLEKTIDAQPLPETSKNALSAALPKPLSALSKTASKPQKTSPLTAGAPKKNTPSNPSPPRQSSQAPLTMQSFDPNGVNDVPQVPVRVAIVTDAQSFTVATSESGIITDSTGKILSKTTPQGALGVTAQGGGVKVGNVYSPSSLWLQTQGEKGLVFVNGRWYRGMVQLISDQGRLLAVNHVEMQPYLYSVVGIEMFPSWPAEALKAQAIAARSYALVHIVRPASPYFDLGSTQRWQAYKGVESEAGSTVSAVDQTRGVVISHKGGIVESLYASSADLVREAHSGFGMSQYGARDLASQNLNYRQILSRFYPGTELSLLQAQ